MSMTLGRFTTTEDPDAGSLRQSGDKVEFDSMIVGASLDEFKARVQQLRGLMDNPDETVFPFTWSEDATFDGFYTDVEVEVSDQPSMMASFAAPFSVRMRRVTGGFAKPSFETLTTSVVRANAHSVTTPQGVVASAYFPSTYGFYESDRSTLPSASGGVADLTTEDGTLNVTYLQAPIAVSTYRSFVKPADYYKASARIEVKYGSTWYPTHGLQLPVDTAGNWRISNGYTRVYPSQVSGNGRFTVETYRAGLWLGREFTLGAYDSSFASWGALFLTGDSLGNLATPRVLRNSHESVSVQCSVVSQKYTISLRRGETFITAALTLPGGAASTLLYGFATSAVVASTAFTGGIRATANDANGLRYLISTPVARTNDLVNGRIYTTAAANSAQYQITADYQAGITTTDALTRDLFLAAGNEHQSVVMG